MKLRRTRQRVIDLEERVAELEARLNGREWNLPPRNTIETVDLPTLPDFSAGWDEDGPDDVWNPLSYL